MASPLSCPSRWAAALLACLSLAYVGAPASAATDCRTTSSPPAGVDQYCEDVPAPAAHPRQIHHAGPRPPAASARAAAGDGPVAGAGMIAALVAITAVMAALGLARLRRRPHAPAA